MFAGVKASAFFIDKRNNENNGRFGDPKKQQHQQRQQSSPRGGRGGGRGGLGNRSSFKNKTWVRSQPDLMEDLSASQPSRKGTMSPAERATRFGQTNQSALYDQLKRNRVLERRQAIEQGFIADPDIPRRLEDAIEFKGTCQTMCPDFEIIEREIQHGLDALEMDEAGNADPDKMVKAYRRSAAGNEQPLPSDVRPPPVLEKTLDYLISDILSSYSLEKCHSFIRDRTRSIRQDFTLQNIRGLSAIKVHERIARFHILSFHEMCELGDEKFSEQQETEQLRKVLLSLMEFYDDLREEEIETENEAEFRAYYLITHIRDQDVARQTMSLPPHLFFHPYIQRALQFYGLAQRNNEILQTASRRHKPENIEASQNFYSKFFKLIRDPGTPFLMSCMLEWHFPEVRKGALKAMNTAYNKAHSGVPVERVRQVLAYDTSEHLLEEVEIYGLPVDMSLEEPYIRFGQKHFTSKAPYFIEPLSNPKPRQSMIVEKKKNGRSLVDIINAENVDAVVPQTSSILATPVAIPLAVDIEALEEEQRRLDAEKLAMQRAKEIESQREAEQKARIQAEEEERRRLEHLREMEMLQKEIAARQREREKEEALKQAEEARRRREEAERLALMKAEMDKQRREAAEEAAFKERLLREKAERELERSRIHATLTELSNKWFNELLETTINEHAEITATKCYQRMRRLRHMTGQWVERVRSRIEKRHKRVARRNQLWHFQQRVTVAQTLTTAKCADQNAKRKATDAIQAELKSLRVCNQIVESKDHSVWETENFAEVVYPLIKTKIKEFEPLREDTSTKSTWQMWIQIANREESAAVWFEHKFGLDREFSRRMEHYDVCNIVVRSVAPGDQLNAQAVEEIGAVVFSLSEMKDARIDDSDK
ncbi:hypothetical protein EC973_005451 [Apophysomyces ossiformis]|uniref:SAC3/GANP/THP3 conserved domain-containing protein n=1 Tax=Apophysomyces ossiformis TaxID=679940 RepID=A0A8H7BZB5_9FUNG|nr:hypothetical protein EC973_005451 [Apophysomyces ossiformis]